MAGLTIITLLSHCGQKKKKKKKNISPYDFLGFDFDMRCNKYKWIKYEWSPNNTYKRDQL